MCSSRCVCDEMEVPRYARLYRSRNFHILVARLLLVFVMMRSACEAGTPPTSITGAVDACLRTSISSISKRSFWMKHLVEPVLEQQISAKGRDLFRIPVCGWLPWVPTISRDVSPAVFFKTFVVAAPIVTRPNLPPGSFRHSD